MLEERLQKHIDLLIKRYPVLGSIQQEIIDAYLIIEECYMNDGKLLVAGNGGSAADSEHIAGELMKRFKIPRPVSEEFAQKLCEIDPVRGKELANNLEGSLIVIPLVAHEALITAYIMMLIVPECSHNNYMIRKKRRRIFWASQHLETARMC